MLCTSRCSQSPWCSASLCIVISGPWNTDGYIGKESKQFQPETRSFIPYLYGRHISGSNRGRVGSCGKNARILYLVGHLEQRFWKVTLRYTVSLAALSLLKLPGYRTEIQRLACLTCHFISANNFTLVFSKARENLHKWLTSFMSFQVKRVSVEPWKKKEAITYSMVLKGFWRKRKSMESKSTLLSGTFHSLWTGSLFGEKNSLWTGYTFQRSCVITNYAGQNNLRGAINGRLYFKSFKMKYTFSAFPPPTDHTQRSRSSYLSFPDPRSRIVFRVPFTHDILRLSQIDRAC